MASFARFRPSRFFRRQSSANSTPNNASSSDCPSDAASTTTTTTTTTTTNYPRTPRSSSRLRLSTPTLRKSSSAARLGEQFGDQGRPEPTIPEARESALLDLCSNYENIDDSARPTPVTLDPRSRRSGSATLAAPSQLGESKSSRSVSAEEVVLKEPGEADSGGSPEPVLVTLEAATPGAPDVVDDNAKGGAPRPLSGEITLVPSASSKRSDSKSLARVLSSPSISPGTQPRATEDRRRRPPSLVQTDNAKIAHSVIDAPPRQDTDGRPFSAASGLPTSAALNYFTPSLPNMANILHRKIWVRRPGASATLVQIRTDDLVDDVRDMILKKYANSLGRTFDAPDMTLRIARRVENSGQRSERVLGPEEDMCRTIDSYYPGGQTVDDALVIDVPQKRTPRPSPPAFQQPNYHALDEYRPLESGTDYFPQMPALVPPTVPQTSGSHDSRTSQHHPSVAAAPEHHRSIAVLNTGQLPLLPSPGGNRRHREHRPRVGRQHTSSPTIISHPSNAGVVGPAPQSLNPAQVHLVHRPGTRGRMESAPPENVMHINGAPAPPPLPTPPAPEAPPTNKNSSTPTTPLAASGVLPHRSTRPKKSRKETPDHPTSKTRHQRNDSEDPNHRPALASGMLDGSVPPINVLIVEDNIINLRILEGLMKRLKVRWQTAMNGQIAVDSWRKGGFHLVLMDIQMPIMNGLAATKEIRRLERVNGIGVFSSSSSPASPADRIDGAVDGEPHAADNPPTTTTKDPDSDRLSTSDGSLFKSPVIIVALTASSLQSDRHEALAAGCNDFLTKPVNFVWLERKVKEWGCMQALIDFDGWRRWKDYAAREEAGKSAEERAAEAEKEERQRVKMEKLAKLQEKQRVKREEEERRKASRKSLEAAVGGGGSDGVAAAGPVAEEQG